VIVFFNPLVVRKYESSNNQSVWEFSLPVELKNCSQDNENGMDGYELKSAFTQSEKSELVFSANPSYDQDYPIAVEYNEEDVGSSILLGKIPLTNDASIQYIKNEKKNYDDNLNAMYGLKDYELELNGKKMNFTYGLEFAKYGGYLAQVKEGEKLLLGETSFTFPKNSTVGFNIRHKGVNYYDGLPAAEKTSFHIVEVDVLGQIDDIAKDQFSQCPIVKKMECQSKEAVKTMRLQFNSDRKIITAKEHCTIYSNLF
jgi:hypothetical protein